MNILETLLLVVSAAVFGVGLHTFRKANRFLGGFSLRRSDDI